MELTIAKWIFWLSATWLGYAYAGHPALLFILSALRPRPWTRGASAPGVSIYVAAFNEAGVIQDRIANLRALRYSGPLEIVIADDGSTDETARLAAEALEDQGRVESAPRNLGKTAMQNRVVPTLSHDVVIFSDATSHWEPELVQLLVRHFDDPAVGCVAADVHFRKPGAEAGAHGQGAYWRYERRLRLLGAKVWTNVVVSGTCYAIRRNLFKDLPPEIAEDLGTPLSIALDGNRVVFDPEAVVVETSAESDAQEARMRRRIALQNITAIAQYFGAVFHRSAFAAYQFFAHKVMRGYCWLAMSLMFPANLILISSGPVYGIAMGLQLAFYGLAIVGYVAEPEGRLATFFSLPKYFVLLNMIYAVAFWDYLNGRRGAQWRTER